MIDITKQLIDVMKRDNSDDKTAGLIVLRELKTKASLLRETMNTEIQYNWLKKMKEEREKSISIYETNNRLDLLKKELAELSWINDMLSILKDEMPKQLNVDEIKETILKLKTSHVVGGLQIKNVMEYFKINYPTTDRKLISTLAKEMIS